MKHQIKSSKNTLSRPRCKGCGKRIYLKYSRFKNYMWRNPPSYCPDCGEQLTLEKKKHLVEHEELIFGIICILFITVFIIVVAFSR